MRRKDEAGMGRASASLARPAIIAVVVVLLIAAYIFFIADREPFSSTLTDDVGARPTGAGSLPDGVVDERIEGLGNETSTDDFIDNSGAADLRPEILDPNRGPGPATDVEELDVPEGVNDSFLEPGPTDR